jgi:hypothetical protein
MKKIKVGGLNYTINYVNGLADSGVSDFEKQTILINDELTDDNKLSTLLHEVIEIVNSQYNLALPHQTIQTLEASLFAVYKDNFI